VEFRCVSLAVSITNGTYLSMAVAVCSASASKLSSSRNSRSPPLAFFSAPPVAAARGTDCHVNSTPSNTSVAESPGTTQSRARQLQLPSASLRR
jgi:hypothetical protein